MADNLLDHFRGTAFTGLIGGAIEVYVRSVSRSGRIEDPPVTIPALESPPYDLAVPAYTAVVIVAGTELADAAESPGAWRDYIEQIADARVANPDTIGLFPVQVAPLALNNTHLGAVVGTIQRAAADAWGKPRFEDTLCRDVAQGIAQMVDPDHQRLTVFISHTKRLDTTEAGAVVRLVDLVRDVIADSRLGEFFDASDLQPGEDWAPTLIEAASHSALLAVRTDLYSSRPWCQREVLAAKRHGMPVVVLDGLRRGEERGSFLMDHVPRVAGHRKVRGWSSEAIWAAVNQLVDECLKRALWRAQQRIASGALGIDIDWWAPHAPEPATFADWLTDIDRDAKRDVPIIVLHPDPPLGDDESAVLRQIGRLAGLNGPVKFLTPRGLAVHGG
ncbi:MAG: hypothetical protein ACJ735_05845 [Actinomycetes bacterium]